MKTKKIIVKTSSHTYPILIGSNLISKISSLLKNNSVTFNQCLLIIDKNVPSKFIEKIKKSLKNKKNFLYYISANEKNKNQKTVNQILNFLFKKNFSRQDCLMTIGGGITGDIGGFAASLFKRGIQYINLPTTLLSQVDSSIGGKTGVNSKYGKNMIGSFYQPKIVISDSLFLKTLPRREIVCGYGEILKHSLISNKGFYSFLNHNISKILSLKSPLIEKAIFESCKIKKAIVEKDEKEKNLRKVLNFGHTFAHAYEAALGYSIKLNHGEAVILGITSAIKFSNKKKIFKNNEFKKILSHIINSKLPYKLKNYFSSNDINKIIYYMLKDKKNNSKNISLILLKKIGSPIINKTYSKDSLKSFLRSELIN